MAFRIIQNLDGENWTITSEEELRSVEPAKTDPREFETVEAAAWAIEQEFAASVGGFFQADQREIPVR